MELPTVRSNKYRTTVLILIIMEDTHGEKNMPVCCSSQYCLNPYYNGRYSWRVTKWSSATVVSVLILIIMEDTHGGSCKVIFNNLLWS